MSPRVKRVIHHCLEKPAYPTEGEARRVMYKMMIAKGFIRTSLRVYECKYNPHFHYGNSRETK